jgi:hypothetical protein
MTVCRNWQDWGLRLARKSTFYAAATYYCRQLGITYSHSPMPLIWANRDGQSPDLNKSPSMFSAQLDVDDAAGPDAIAPGSRDLKPMLGFLPPPERRDAHLLRARKSKGGKKAAMRAMDG